MSSTIANNLWLQPQKSTIVTELAYVAENTSITKACTPILITVKAKTNDDF